MSLRKYVYHLAKYGIAYWREYVKKTYKKEYFTEDNVTKARWVYDVYDQVAENIHPKNITLDDNCIGVKDVNKPANDLFIMEFLTQAEYDSSYPAEKYERSEFVKEGGNWMVDPQFIDQNDDNKNDRSDRPKKILVLTYENKAEGLREIWANEVPLESIPLPGGELSVQGEKWMENVDNYDGIGVGSVLEIYQSIVDDILNASLERLRQIVRPNEDRFNDIENSDESDDVEFGSSSVRKWSGNPKDIVYTSPPARTGQERSEMEDTSDEIDTASMIPKNLSGTDDSKTAFQSAQNREAALNKLSIPLDSIKFTIEDAANLSFKLFKEVYQEPLKTTILTKEDDDFDEARAILDNANRVQGEEQRVVEMGKGDEVEIDGKMQKMKGGELARREFRQMELPVTAEADENEEETKEDSKPTARFVESEEKEFWELIPGTFNWDGRLEVVAESFLPPSKALEDDRKSRLIEFLMQIQTTDEMGNPVLKDANGQPFMIDRVRLIKEKVKLSRDFDPVRS